MYYFKNFLFIENTTTKVRELLINVCFSILYISLSFAHTDHFEVLF